MKTIPGLLDAVPTDNLAIVEQDGDVRLRSPALALESNGEMLVCASGFGGGRQRAEAEQKLTLFKLLVEGSSEVGGESADTIELEDRIAELEDQLGSIDALNAKITAAADRADKFEAERDVLKKTVADLTGDLDSAETARKNEADRLGKLETALTEILSSDTTSAKRAKEIAEGVMG